MFLSSGTFPEHPSYALCGRVFLPPSPPLESSLYALYMVAPRIRIQPCPDDLKKHPSQDLLELLLLADPDLKRVTDYLCLSNSKVLLATEGEQMVGTAVLFLEGQAAELKNIAVDEAHQGRGIAKQLIAKVKELAQSKGAVVLEVGTGNSSLDQLALYQKCGFRIAGVEKDFFADYPDEIWENGIRCLDMVRLRMEL